MVIIGTPTTGGCKAYEWTSGGVVEKAPSDCDTGTGGTKAVAFDSTTRYKNLFSPHYHYLAPLKPTQVS